MIDAGAGPPVLLLHGWSQDASAFAGLAARLAPRLRVIAPDLPGHGGAGRASLDGAAEAVDEVLAARGLAGVTLVGWSLGAAAGWRLLEATGAGRVACMISLDMSPKLAREAGWGFGLASAAALAATTARMEADWPGAAEGVAAGMFAAGRDPDPALKAQALARIRAKEAGPLLAMWRDLCAADLRPAVRRLPVPLLAVQGGRSRLYPAEVGEWLARTAPQGRCETIAEAGHSPPLETPGRLAELIARAAGA